MSDNIKRYENLIKLSLQVYEKRSELNNLYDEISRNITLHEASKRDFDNTDCIKALAIIEATLTGVEFEECTHVKMQLNYGISNIYLHCDHKVKGNKALVEIMSEIKTNEILG